VGSVGKTSGGGGAAGGAGLTGAPMLGAFLRNVAAVPPATRSAHIAAQAGASASRRFDDPGSSDPGVPLPPDVFPTEPTEPVVYFDYYLGLWVKVEYLTGGATYSLYSDEALTEPAGNIATTEPSNWESYPLVWRSEYAFRAGYLAGAHGRSESSTNRDGSGSQSYENTYADGGSDEGRSAWTARGDYTWTSRTDFTGGAWTTGSGSFRADGGGGTRWETSEGYKGDYTYNADGSGRARITGPDPGLPVTITWDAYGNTTIVYADGSIERIPGWGYYGGGGTGTTGSGGGTPEPIPL
ncbi:MAG TPA: hypothetical protein VM490_07125, partial [Armatimonadaceae bacterium]|nr:hypothetical protein [Armatimonadaceae bacterium]